MPVVLVASIRVFSVKSALGVDTQRFLSSRPVSKTQQDHRYPIAARQATRDDLRFVISVFFQC